MCVFRIVISDVESVAFRSVSFGMDGGVSRIVAFKTIQKEVLDVHIGNESRNIINKSSDLMRSGG